MIDSKNRSRSKEARYRLSVLDTLLNRTACDGFEVGSSSGLRVLYSDSDPCSHHVSPPSSQNLSENGLTNTTIDSPLFAETKTPTTRCQQLPILLARNYYTAPACLLKFVNSGSTIRSYMSRKRDSDGTVIDNQFDPLVDCNVETNDEMDNFKSDGDCRSSFSVGSMTNRTSLMSDHQFRDPDEPPYIGVDPIDLSMVLQSVKSRYSAHFDKGCSPFTGLHEPRRSFKAKETVDMGTSPLFFDEPDSRPRRASQPAGKPAPLLAPEPTELDSYKGSESKNLDTTHTEADFCRSDFPGASADPPGPGHTLDGSDLPRRKSESGGRRQMPVYCRSLLYRIRVPLSKRLKNVDEDVLVKSMGSPMLSATRVNLSCDRLYSSSALANSADSNFSVLRMSDLDSNSFESSRSARAPTRDSSRRQAPGPARPKRPSAGPPALEGRRAASKRSRRASQRALI